MINRANYRLLSAYLEYQRRVLQLGDDSAERYRFYLRHVLLWAGESPLAQAHALRPTLPDYLMASGSRDGRAPRAAATHRKIVQNAKRLLSWAKLTYPREYRDLPMAWIDALRPPRGAADHPRPLEPRQARLVRQRSVRTKASSDKAIR